ncbi:DNA fragmentation factor subunit alpha-like isoform X1 [Schistocerca gregaria]|uniref:DNA fragmentation factor subunit alpha-like isoform X1 n=1 Tax=Schistocerca gregaria TaxID=7010 RepID=UPI00211DC8DB|nr:DNA fragmentation factor subunit alpha-like isoform X1 [Schistocerca gregaria]XP_049847461.1 DNA fragmentation factor subunit alpha-like isoform X1 [Schistocerca gregaria]XP_049847462.1 DNA fragmentation factor subunit alpha-like isoform X1 [Schistocerca gregaria]
MEKSTEEAQSVKGIPLKVVDLARECKKGVVASTLQELISRARGKLGVPDNVPVKIVLEQDGTEVDDDEYFSTVEKNTVVMLLKNDEKWLPPGKFHRVRRISDETDGPRFGPKDKELSSLVDRLQGDLTHISMLGGRELELLSNMDPESLIDIFPESVAETEITSDTSDEETSFGHLDQTQKGTPAIVDTVESDSEEDSIDINGSSGDSSVDYLGWNEGTSSPL